MKTNIFKIFTLFFLIILSVSCSKDDEVSTEYTQNTSTTTTNTWVKLTARTINGTVKPNYKIMMFSTEPSMTAALPPILKEVTTDVNGLAYFDLNSMITSSTPTTYYFEAFTDTPTGYQLRSISHFNTEIKKGNMVTSSILVN